MTERMKMWFEAQGNNRSEIIRRLTSDSVKNHGNKRIGFTSTDETSHSHGSLPPGGLQGVLAAQGVHVVSIALRERIDGKERNFTDVYVLFATIAWCWCAKCRPGSHVWQDGGHLVVVAIMI